MFPHPNSQRGIVNLLLCLSVLVLIQSGIRVLKVHVPPPTLTRTPAEGASTFDSSPVHLASSLDDLTVLVQHATARNPFRSDRARAPARFGSITSVAPAAPESHSRPPDSRPAPPELRLLGIVAESPARSLAAVALNGHEPRVLRPGEETGGYRLLGVTATAARFSIGDSVLVLRLTPAGP